VVNVRANPQKHMSKLMSATTPLSSEEPIDPTMPLRRLCGTNFRKARRDPNVESAQHGCLTLSVSRARRFQNISYTRIIMAMTERPNIN
jgi:hypothetical protein